MLKHICSIATFWLALAASAAEEQPQAVAALKNVRVLATGGTIAGAGEGSSASYRAGVVSIGDMLRTAPGLAEIANMSAEQVANVGSYDMDDAVWRRLLGRIQAALAETEISGVVNHARDRHAGRNRVLFKIDHTLGQADRRGWFDATEHGHFGQRSAKPHGCRASGMLR